LSPVSADSEFESCASGFSPYTFCVSNAFMARAIQLAIENVRLSRGGPFGAVIVTEGKIIAEGVNRVTSLNDPTAHAEIVAIREASNRLRRFDLSGCELYTSCEPCPMCFGAIYWARLDRIYFGSDASDAAEAGFADSFIYAEIAKLPADRTIPILQLMRTEALEAFRTWQQQPNKIAY
jgi:guanine deaminase